MIFGHPIELPPNEPLWSYTPMPAPMPEPTTHTLGELLNRLAHAIHEVSSHNYPENVVVVNEAFDDLEQALASEAASHKETARRATEAFTHLLDPYIIGRLQDHIAAAIASAVRAERSNTVTKLTAVVKSWLDAEWIDQSTYYHFEAAARAVEPARVPQGETQ